MESIRASSKGQMIIPKSVRDALDIRSGTELGVELLPDKAFKVVVKAANHIEQVQKIAGSLAHRAKRMTAIQEARAIAKAIGADDERTRRRGK